MKLAIHLTLSLAMLSLCMWLVWPDPAVREQVGAALRAVSWADFSPYLASYLGLLVIVHA